MAEAAAAAIGGALLEKGVDQVVKYVKGSKGSARKQKPKKKKVMMIAKPKKKKQVKKQVGQAPIGPMIPYREQGESFKTSYHKQSMVKVGRINKFGKSVPSDTMRCRGRLLLGPVMVTSNTAAYTNFFQFAVNPNSFPSTKLAEVAKLYQKFRFNKLVLEYQSTTSVNNNGALMNYYIYDPEVQLAGNPGNLSYMQAISQLNGTTTNAIWAPKNTSFPIPDDGSEYYVAPDTNGEERLTTQGVIGSLSMTTLQGQNTWGFGFLTYEIDFWEDAFQSMNYDSMLVLPATYPNLATNFINDQLQGFVNVAFVGSNNLYSALTTSTTYTVIPSYGLGYMKPHNVYYVTTPSAYPTTATYTVNLYTTLYDSKNATNENRVSGSLAYADVPPTNGFSFWQVVGSQNVDVSKSFHGLTLDGKPVDKSVVRLVLEATKPGLEPDCTVLDSLESKGLITINDGVYVIDSDYPSKGPTSSLRRGSGST